MMLSSPPSYLKDAAPGEVHVVFMLTNTHSPYGIGCIRCGETLIAPDWSKYISSRQVHHAWSCESCGVQFETSDHLWSPEPRRTVLPVCTENSVRVGLVTESPNVTRQ